METPKKKQEASISELFKTGLKNALTSEYKWADKDEFLDVVYWIRQLVGIILGLIWGVLSLKGMFAIILFFAINAGIIYFYATSYQKIDEEEFGGLWEVIKEGLMTSFSTFLVLWIIIYSTINNFTQL